MTGFLFDTMYESTPDRDEVAGAAATVVLTSVVPLSSATTVDDLTGVLDTASSTWLASTGLQWWAMLAAQPTLEGTAAVGYAVALGSGGTATLVRFEAFASPTSDPVTVTSDALLAVGEGGVPTAPEVAYEPADPDGYSVPPVHVAAALDDLAARQRVAAGVHVVDLTGETPSVSPPLEVDLSDVTAAAVEVLCPNGGESVVLVTDLPDSASRGPLAVAAWAADGSTVSLATAEGPGAATSSSASEDRATWALEPSSLPGGWRDATRGAWDWALTLDAMAPLLTALNATAAADGDVLTATGTAAPDGFGWETP